MAQRDYVRRSQSPNPRRKKNTSGKKPQQRSLSPRLIIVAAVVVFIFIGGLYFMTHNKPETIKENNEHKATTNSLPPKPEERWSYIKELENRQPIVHAPTEPTSGGNVVNRDQLTNEQRQLLEQLQEDKKLAPTQLNEVPWNDQISVAHQKQSERAVTKRVQSESKNESSYTSSPLSKNETPKASSSTRESMTTKNDSSTDKSSTVEKKDDKRWMIQCASFRVREQAESVRAQLAFEGFDAHITASQNNDWNRVVIGPIKGKEATTNTISRLKLSGHANCITIPVRG